MIYFSEKELDDLLLEDIYRGDLTSHALNIENIPAKMLFKRKNSGMVAGIQVAEKLLKKLELCPQVYVKDGELVDKGQVLIEVKGTAKRLHQAWKVVQLVLEWSCGVAQYTYDMVQNAKLINANAVVACTRKSIPNTRKLATNAVLAGGGHIHRQGISETLLVFTNHRNLCSQPENWQQIVSQIRCEAPENKVTVEADNLEQFSAMLSAEPDIIQCDKFSIEQTKTAVALLTQYHQAHPTAKIQISVAGGINKDNVAEYAKTGVNLFITSAPYYAMPEDIKVVIEKA
ncbi:ModD protein [Pasteurella bettyae]|uniref:Putative pyrophosphorylase ModD n=1 Tax=Pasteurella bettyae CCUG 2042 TaxID=1095749 RepID=I3DBD3_9PAST|nr:ModD protein [Pasteurella bettyae]EIJ69026.1 quinolinate phosphoribosyl transferase, C-terminal domain protein NadC [Pasteurella bettyae CCUG 2042]SUB22933.1 pyrophosphorylase ModD [Pasteurella bettyae]